MTPERWREVKEAFQQLLEVPTSEHAARLAKLDTDVRDEVVAMLAAATTGAQDFLEPPTARSLAATDDDNASGVRIGRRVGPWRIVEELGRGGMGAVYLARREDQEVEGEVALKVVKRGMDTDVVLRRFRAERQILAGLSHPNIGRLLDAGSTDDGTPWFSMELVRGGEPIDRYCGRRQLDVEGRPALQGRRARVRRLRDVSRPRGDLHARQRGAHSSDACCARRARRALQGEVRRARGHRDHVERRLHQAAGARRSR